MPLFPYRAYQVMSAKTPVEVEAALRGVVQEPRVFWLGARTRPFEGEVGDGRFNVRRTIGYRNSFLPRIRGTIAATSGGSRIDVRMSLHPVVLVFMVVWLGGVAAGFAAMLVSDGRGAQTGFGPFGAALMFIFGWALASIAFSFEQRKAERLLAEVWTGDRPRLPDERR